MTTCDYDGVFYRVFCITLLAIALTFTVILTNVFVDIDGLLTNKRDTRKNLDADTTLTDDVDITFTPEIVQTDPRYNEKQNEESYRSKRSLETKNFRFHIKNSKMKSVLTNRLAMLLDELDAGDTGSNKNQSESETSIEKNKDDIKNTKLEQETKTENKDIQHSNIHEVLLRGIIGHMDFNEVYDMIHALSSKNKDTKKEDTAKLGTKKIENLKPIPNNEEKEIFNEIMNCKELKKQVIEATKKTKEDNKRRIILHKGPKVIIKTLIDIKSPSSNIQEKAEATSKENVKGLVKLMYNGKSIKFNQMDDYDSMFKLQNTTNAQISGEGDPVIIDYKEDNPKSKVTNHRDQNKDINKLIQEFIARNNDYEEMAEVKQETPRIKRHVKIRYDDTSHTSKRPLRKDDDELFVEIETHFDSKGTQGEKKKKIIRNLIEKIQQAIHSKPEEGKKKNFMDIHVKKRFQNPLNNRNIGKLINKISLPYESTVHRHLDPINKILPVHQLLTYTADKSTETKKYTPKFLAVSKSINSAEMNEVDLDYNRVILLNDIPQRIQQPLNSNKSEETQIDSAYNNLGKLKFFVKDIDGSGFSIGFNQYVDEPPDKEAMNLFTGLQNIIQTYHQTYDQTETPIEVGKIEKPEEVNEEVDNSPAEHIVVRRSINSRFGDDYHSNEYKIIFDNNYLPYDSYEDIFKTKINNMKNSETTKFMREDEKHLVSNFIVDDDIFNKNLQPSEIFGLANLIHRKKRSLKVKKISNLKKKMKINRYLNTKAMPTKRIFLNKKRSKRQIDKIRIIATEHLPNVQRNSEENIFVVSDENVLADRAIVGEEVETPEIEHVRIEDDHYDIVSPYVYEDLANQPVVTNTFSGKFRHNTLMSKYPHIFMEEISRSKEEEIMPENTLILNKNMNPSFQSNNGGATTQKITAETKIPLPKVEEIVNAIIPQNDKSNYKLTVKIMPKNTSNTNPGFKEVHTIINKSYNKNGLTYSSLVNVSEISKIVQLNKTDTNNKPEITKQSPVVAQVMRQRQTINFLLNQHKYRIEEQLKHLIQEKQILDQMTLSTGPSLEETQDKYVDVVLPLDPPKALRLTKEEMNNLAVATLLQLPENTVVDIQATTVLAPTSQIMSSATQKTTTPTTIPTIPRTTRESIRQIEKQLIKQKTKMIDNIERNGNLTNEILKKIDKNTEILQTFLQKLADNIDLMPKHKLDGTNPTKNNLNHLKVKSNHLETFNQVMPNIDMSNGTNQGIPFVYAFQQSYPLPNKSEPSVASLVYHGHIHTNTLNKRTESLPAKEDKSSVKEEKRNNGRRNLNQTRFFIDGIENDFKIIPFNSVKKSDYMKLLNNTNVH